MLMVMAVAAGCSKTENNGDANSLLRTIPADASTVVMLNLDQSVKSLGCKTDGKTIELSKDLQKAIFESNAISDKNKQIFTDICSGETGVSITSIAYFSAARSYVTGLLDDPDKFVAYVQRREYQDATDSVSASIPVAEQDGARVIDNIVVAGNQFWICTEGRPDVDQLKYYQKLNDQQSYASSKCASRLLEDGKMLTYVADVRRTLDRMPESAYARLGISLMFDDFAYVAGSAEMKNKNINSVASVLNSSMAPAELVLPAEKIDASVVKSLNKDGEIFVAAGLSQKLTKKIADAAGNLVSGTAKIAVNSIEQIDGTVAICTNLNASCLEARIQTTGKDFVSLSQIIQMFSGATVTRDGDMLTVRYGDSVSPGQITAADAASKLKGAWIGVLVADLPINGMTTLARIVPDGKSVKFDLEINNGLEAILDGLLK